MQTFTAKDCIYVPMWFKIRAVFHNAFGWYISDNKPAGFSH